jgi:hypothetical protein
VGSVTPCRNPSADPTPLDRASWYIESLKYGAGPGVLEATEWDAVVGQMETLLRDAGAQSMTGAELLEATEYYSRSFAGTLGVPILLTRSLFVDGLMHGIALAGGVEGEPRDSRPR